MAPPSLDENSLPHCPEVRFHLWFYRFSICDCINSALTFPFLIRIFIYFTEHHSDTFVYLTWDAYIVQCMMVGHYLVDLEEIFSHGYASLSRDLLIHHFIAFFVFIYHMTALFSFRWITIILFLEISSFFLRLSLILKFHDPEQIGLVWNVNCVLNILAMVFVRFTVLLRYWVWDFVVNFWLMTVMLWYTIVIFVIACLMCYLAWTSWKYMMKRDVPKMKRYFVSEFKRFGG